MLKLVKAYTAHAVIATMLILTIFWHEEEIIGGFGSVGGALFNWHPLLMVVGYGVLMAEAMLMFRVTDMSRPLMKTVHAVLNTLGVACTCVGMWAVFAFKARFVNAQGEPAPIPDMYSSHSWVGMAVFALSNLQLVVSVLVFWIPGLAGPKIKAAMMPFHKVSGKAVLLGSAASFISGMAQKQSFIRGVTERFGRVNIFANVLTLFFFFWGFAMLLVLEIEPISKKAGKEATEAPKDLGQSAITAPATARPAPAGAGSPLGA
uniref:Cytochrome b561 domain-containing protein n=1 Tax=Chromera velia CCMP2878 TaxID=1169474 RepID=A0A0G4HMA9_9ALVE|mmetsp:Transcript_6124/g.12105  ORF Transcript_6124/g.12105 Transcript_6124/m.12105 type:complete len:262 (+) Transcript_6124:129-914(+)|eukprot:Cvel_29029.t1-p1 / transcript=Cvel_29029.t1 / gene=Cvel_29029 / organism=Chromera_velia_CCMP2878 / gene_product=Cytochrome b reductase 1, putative / transcript_product=Cytochrome b reductase 1, putative / location=Cvel_scaffold3911:4499-10039(+) / protein_length=261 / sequence_SO=supercontig / SO=protein_coding / is_pseudo=false